MVNVNDWINANWEELQITAKKITKNDQHWEELLHIVILDFLQKENLQEILDSWDGNGARFYVVRMLLNQYRSSSSPYHKLNRDLIIDYDENHHSTYDSNYIFGMEDYTDEEFDVAMDELDRLTWYDCMLFKTLVNEGHTFTSLSKETGISRNSIGVTINRVKNHLKKKINEFRKNQD